MADSTTSGSTNDSEELQALFDSVAASTTAPVVAKPAAKPDTSGDSDELQALFDNISAQNEVQQVDVSEGPTDDLVFNKLGHMARQLHNTLRELGYDKMLEETAAQIPDARQRLTYIAQMTEQAASRVLNATDAAKPLQDEMLAQSEALSVRWDKAFANELSVDEFKQLAGSTRDYFHASPDKHRATNDHLMEIMMAQDFQDLTGQVIKRVVDMAQELEASLVSLLIEAMPADRKIEKNEGLLNGPVFDAAGRSDVVSSQSQVDDLLESLGF
jgi:chemotaxis protein CheZ